MGYSDGSNLSRFAKITWVSTPNIIIFTEEIKTFK